MEQGGGSTNRDKFWALKYATSCFATTRHRQRQWQPRHNVLRQRNMANKKNIHMMNIGQQLWHKNNIHTPISFHLPPIPQLPLPPPYPYYSPTPVKFFHLPPTPQLPLSPPISLLLPNWGKLPLQFLPNLPFFPLPHSHLPTSTPPHIPPQLWSLFNILKPCRVVAKVVTSAQLCCGVIILYRSFLAW